MPFRVFLIGASIALTAPGLVGCSGSNHWDGGNLTIDHHPARESAG